MKGDLNDECNRTVCHRSPANWYNHSTRKHYCHECALILNRENERDAMRLFGHALCTIVEPKEEESQEELREMIAKVHDHIEGRYELDSYDYGIIHALLCKLQ
jgi:hypothetical protein